MVVVVVVDGVVAFARGITADDEDDDTDDVAVAELLAVSRVGIDANEDGSKALDAALILLIFSNAAS